jgi:cytochrome c oxidase assembly protein subunit 15
MLVKNKLVIAWMILGLILIFFQIIIGGVTRLTGSGLSITKWEIVTGVVPPMSAEGWQGEFEKYQATPQYQKLNKGMTIGEFKFIYFWEYLHRLWARSMGIIFLFPFLYFVRKGWIKHEIVKRLIILAVIAGFVGLFGWIMVASGLIDRPWVNAYKLSIHLCLALLVYGYLLWTILLSLFAGKMLPDKSDRWFLTFLLLLCIQVFLGGVMSGMRAALLYPTWPDMQGEFVPSVLYGPSSWSVSNFVDYDKGIFMGSLVQFLHRIFGYTLFISGLYLFWRFRVRAENTFFSIVRWVFISLLVCQVLLGIQLLLSSIGSIPVVYGVLHQAVAILVLSCALCLYYDRRYSSI